MKPYPLYNDKGTMRAFEITSAWFTLRPIFKILRGVDGVTNVKRNWLQDDRIVFRYFGKDAAVNEQWGDNSRYWIGVISPDEAATLKIEPIEAAFQAYRRMPWIWLWQQGTDDS